MIGFTVCGASRDHDSYADTGEIRRLRPPRPLRLGVGRALMGAALADFAAGYMGFPVWSFAANDQAEAVYEAFGFARDGSERTERRGQHPAVRYRHA